MAGKYEGKPAAQYEEFYVEDFDPASVPGDYDPQKLAEQRIAWLCTQHRILMRRNQLSGTSYPAWWKEARARLRSVLGWYPKGMDLVGVTEEEMGFSSGSLPSMTSKDGKALTLAAMALDEREAEWLDEWTASCYADARLAYNIVPHLEYWTKPKNSFNNKLLNCIKGHELRVIGDLRGKLASRTGA